MHGSISHVDELVEEDDECGSKEQQDGKHEEEVGPSIRQVGVVVSGDSNGEEELGDGQQGVEDVVGEGSERRRAVLQADAHGLKGEGDGHLKGGTG